MRKSKLLLSLSINLFIPLTAFSQQKANTTSTGNDLKERKEVTVQKNIPSAIKTGTQDVPIIVTNNKPGNGKSEDVILPVITNRPSDKRTADVDLATISNRPGNGLTEDVFMPTIINKPGNGQFNDVNITPAANETPVTSVQSACTFSGRITSTDPALPTRLSRDAIVPSCNTLKNFPGTLNSGTFYYDYIELNNTTGNAQCVTITISTTDPTEQVHVTAYYNIFDPANLQTNYLGDCGSSAFNGTSRTFTVNVANNAKLVLIINDAISGNVMTQDYSLYVSGLACPPACYASGRITSTLPAASNRLNRDAIASQCGISKTFPGVSAGVYRYETHYFKNSSGAAQCVSITASTSDPAEQVHITAYLNSFDPANLQTNYLGDCGSSASNGTSKTFQVVIPNGETLVLVAMDPVTGNVMTQDYNLEIKGLPCPPACNLNGRITSSLPTTTARLFRDAVQSQCSSNKTFPGTSSGTYYYETHYLPNNTGSTQCVTITSSTTDPTEQIHVTAYLNSFDPANWQTNYLGDCGNSAFLNNPKTFKVNVPNGATLVLVANDPLTGNVMTQDYTIAVTGLPCQPSCAVAGRIVSTLPTSSSRLFRDAITSQCSSNKTFPGTSSGNYYYETHYFQNTSGNTQCVTINVSTSDPAEQIHVTAYLNSFDPTNWQTNYLGDCGNSAFLNNPKTFKVNIPNGATLVLVANDPLSGNVMTQDYVLSITGITCPPACSVTGRITSLLPASSARLNRDAIPSQCSNTKTFPGTSAGTYYYNTHYFQNTTGSTQCVTIYTSTSDPAEQVHVTAYFNSFDPTNWQTNYLGDCGSSASLNTPKTFKVNVPNGATLVLVTNDAISGNLMSQDYTISVTGIPCRPSCVVSGKIINTAPTTTARLFRDANPSQCSSNKAFPGTITGTYYYNTHYFHNTTGSSQCVSITTSTTDPTQEVMVTAYLNSFDPNNLQTNYLGDAGSSASFSTSRTFKVNVPAGATLVLAASNPISGAAMTQDYSIYVSGLPCTPSCSVSGRIINTMPTTTARLFRDANASQCSFSKAFPGSVTGTYYYNTHYYENTSGKSQCVSITTSNTDPNQEVMVTAYLNYFDPTNLQTNYLGDAGSSASSTVARTFKVNVPDRTTLVLMASNPVNSAVMTQDYTIDVTGISCSAAYSYVFTGNGNWDVAANWLNNAIPPAAIPPGTRIFIDPAVGGVCNLNVAYTVPKGCSITVNNNKAFIVAGNLQIIN